MKQILTVLTLCLFLIGFSQNNAVPFGEKLTFTASYNMSGILTDIAQVKMETSKVSTSSKTLMRLKCTAATFSKWDSFFKVRDLYESYVNPYTMKPSLYKRDINESGYYKFMQYKFSSKSNRVKSLKRKRRKDGSTWDEEKTLNIGASTKDLVSTFYYIRTLDIHKASVGDTQNFTVLFDNKQTTITLKLVGKETISTKIGRKECYKLALSLRGSNALKGNNNTLWLTADENKIPVYATFKIPVGNGELKIASATGLKN